MAGETARAHGVLARLHDMAEQRYVMPSHFAYVCTGLGEHEKAIDLLEVAVEERAGGAYGIKGSFLFTPLRSHPTANTCSSVSRRTSGGLTSG